MAAVADGAVGGKDRSTHRAVIREDSGGQAAHPEMGYRGCLGIIRLADKYSPGHVEAAGMADASGMVFAFAGIPNVKQSQVRLPNRLQSQKSFRFNHRVESMARRWLGVACGASLPKMKTVGTHPPIPRDSKV